MNIFRVNNRRGARYVYPRVGELVTQGDYGVFLLYVRMSDMLLLDNESWAPIQYKDVVLPV